MRTPSFLTLFLTLLLIIFSTSRLFAADTLDIYSDSMDRTLSAAVVMPASYSNTADPYPVIYLLHGATGNFSNWLTQPKVEGLVQRQADRYGIIFVMPEGDEYSFYYDSPGNENSQFETHITREVIPHIDTRYNTIEEKSGRAITGLSMGGHGALYLSARNPGLFVAAGSMSGALNMDVGQWDLPPDGENHFLQQLTRVLGDVEDAREFLAEHSVSNMTALLGENELPLIIDCGVDDFLLEANRNLNRRLLEEGVPHDYIERPGAHDWEYWTNALLYQVLFFSEIFR
ncbi:MAG: alpha/beta hydrolase [Bacteroidota bacterium]